MSAELEQKRLELACTYAKNPVVISYRVFYVKIAFVNSTYKGDSMEILSYLGQNIEVDTESCYVNLSQMCLANDKRINNYLRNTDTQDYIAECVQETLISAGQLVYKQTVSNVVSYWGHELVAIHLAQWISPKFHLWCNKHLIRLLTTGKTQLDTELEQKRLELAKVKQETSTQWRYYEDASENASKATQKSIVANLEITRLERQLKRLAFEVNKLESIKSDLLKINKRLKKEAKA